MAPHHTCCCRGLQAEQSIEASFLSEAEMVFATLSSTQVGGAGGALVAGGAAAARAVQPVGERAGSVDGAVKGAAAEVHQPQRSHGGRLHVLSSSTPPERDVPPTLLYRFLF